MPGGVIAPGWEGALALGPFDLTPVPTERDRGREELGEQAQARTAGEPGQALVVGELGDVNRALGKPGLCESPGPGGGCFSFAALSPTGDAGSVSALHR